MALRNFVEEAKECNISSNEIQTSFDIVNLYSLVPIDEAAAVIIEIQWNLYKADTIGAKKKVSVLKRCPLYRDFF